MAKQQRQCVSYIRVSGESQVRAGRDGVERQRRVVNAWAKRTRTAIVREYADLAVSGTKAGEDRPAMVQMFADLVASGGIPPIVVIERQDRLARDLIEGELILKKLNSLGVKLVCAETGATVTEDQTPTGVLVRQILGAVAQFDKSSIVSKLRTARQAKRNATGRCEGRKPYGSRLGEEVGVKMIHDLRRQGLSLASITASLTEARIPTRSGKPWTRASVLKVANRG
jgi:DNA invertase Pin-like site-specific DNA recombinase